MSGSLGVARASVSGVVVASNLRSGVEAARCWGSVLVRLFSVVLTARSGRNVLGECQSPMSTRMRDDQMSQQTIKQQARRTAREMAEKRRRERAAREARTVDLAEQVMVAIGERDAAVAEAEKRAGVALRELTEVEGLSLGEAVEWCGDTVTLREATRLRRLATDDHDDRAGADRGRIDRGQAERPAMTPATGESGAAGASTAAG